MGTTSAFESLFFPGDPIVMTFTIPDPSVAVDGDSRPELGIYRFPVPLTMTVLGASSFATFTSAALEIQVHNDVGVFDRIVASGLTSKSSIGVVPQLLLFELWEGPSNTLNSDALDFGSPPWHLIGQSGASFLVTTSFHSSFDIIGGNITRGITTGAVAAVPEPSSALLLSVGVSLAALPRIRQACRWTGRRRFHTKTP